MTDTSDAYHDPDSKDCPTCNGDVRICANTPAVHCGSPQETFTPEINAQIVAMGIINKRGELRKGYGGDAE